MSKKIGPVLALLLFFFLSSFASKNLNDSPEFFKEHLQKKVYDIDTAARAIVLYESMSYVIAPDVQNVLYNNCTVRRIIKILRPGGVTEGDVIIGVRGSQYRYGGITKVSGITYNLDNDEILKQEMSNASINITRASDNIIMGKFSLPAVKEGSIIDYTYETKQRINTYLGSWHIQEDLPKLISEASLIYPTHMHIALQSHNTPVFDQLDDTKSVEGSSESYSTPVITVKSDYFSKRWVRKNIPPRFDEPYIFNLEDYTERIVFIEPGAKSTANFGGASVELSSGILNWKYINQRALENKIAFGQLLTLTRKPTKQFLSKIGSTSGDKLEYAKKIYAFVRDSFSYKDESNVSTARELVWVLSNNSGNRMDYHLALIAALREAGMKAYPVLLSTRDNGKLVEDFPNFNALNYVVTRLELDGQVYYLDPTQRYYGFGMIPPKCFNGFSWVVTDTGSGIHLDASDIKEKMFVQLKTVSSDEKDYQLVVKKVYGKYKGAERRERWNKDTLLIRREINDEVKSLELGAKLVRHNVYNLLNADTSLVVEYVVRFDFSADELFLNPSLVNYFTETPLKAEKRSNPVEFPYALDVNYSLNLILPQSYIVEEVPPLIN